MEVDWADWEDVEWANDGSISMGLGSGTSRKAMQISKEALHVNLIRITYFLEEFDEGNRFRFYVSANFDNNSKEKSIDISVQCRDEDLANEEKVWLDRSDMVRKKVQEVFDEDWGVNLQWKNQRSGCIITDPGPECFVPPRPSLDMTVHEDMIAAGFTEEEIWACFVWLARGN